MKGYIATMVAGVIGMMQATAQAQPINNYYNSPYPNAYNDVPSLIPQNQTTTVTPLIPTNQTTTITPLVPSNQTSTIPSLIPLTPNNNLAPLAFPNQPQPAGLNPQTTTLQQLYPQPGLPGQQQSGQQQPVTFAPIQLPVAPYQTVEPPENLTPGLLTIKEGQWVVSDFFYNLAPNIGIKVEVIKPKGKYVPVNEGFLEKQIADIFQDNGINPTVQNISCTPPLPTFHVLVMAYPWQDRCVGFVTTELYEEGRPHRFEEKLNGVWQFITWQRQTLVACGCDEFSREVEQTLRDIVIAFADRYRYYHPQPIRKCFPGEPSEGIRHKRASENVTPIQLRPEVRQAFPIAPEAPPLQAKGMGGY
jgi:hypothetical protein